MSDTTELAWAAGFFDGEGCILRGGSYGKGKRSGRALLSVAVGQVDRRPLERFQRILGGNINGPYHINNPKRRPLHYWRVQGAQAGTVLSAIWPYLSQPKQEQTIAVLRRLKELNSGFVDGRRRAA